MTQHKNIHVALAAAQAQMSVPKKGSTNPHFRSKYADLTEDIQAALPALNANGIAVWHSVVSMDGVHFMRTTFTHGESETEILCNIPLIVSKNDMQGFKSATTYARRIGIESLACLAAEDDDGNAAAAAAPKRAEPKRVEATVDPSDETDKAVDFISCAMTMEQLERRLSKLEMEKPKLAQSLSVKGAYEVRKQQLEAAE